MRWTKEAHAELLKSYREGARKCDISRNLGLSHARISQILQKAERLERDEKSQDPYKKLTVRTRNCLIQANLLTVELVRAAIADGRIDDVYGIGNVGKSEVMRWVDELESSHD